MKGYAPQHIAAALSESNIEIDRDKKGNNVLKVVIRREKYHGVGGLADARAQEFGSGIHNKTNFQSPMQKKYGTGPQGKIRIMPKNKTFLAFEWETADRDLLKASRINHWQKMKKEGSIVSEVGLPSFAGFGRDEKTLLFNWVDHPGIPPYKGKGYIGIAVRDAQTKISGEIGEDAASELIVKIRKIFSRPGGVNK